MGGNIPKIIESASSVRDLEARLREDGHSFRTIGGLKAFAKKEWENHQWPAVERILDAPLEEGIFPTVSFKSEGVEYVLHGIVHGGNRIITPGFGADPEVKRYFKDSALEIVSPSFGQRRSFFIDLSSDLGQGCLLEQGMSNLVGFAKKYELKDHTCDRKTIKLPPIVKLAITPPLIASFLVIFPPLFGLTYLIASKIKDPKDTKEAFLYTIMKSLKDPRYQLKAFQVQTAAELPQPLDMELENMIEKGSARQWFMRLYACQPRLPTTAERSFWTARQMEKYAKKNGMQKLHYIGGAGHTSQIKYCLEHPEYDLEAACRYKKERHHH